jgi:hypothetical protein
LEELRKVGNSVGKISTSDEAVSRLQYKLSKLRDFILRKIQTTKDHKLSPIWEEPFEVVKVTRPGSYRLQQEDGSEVSNSWNIDQLRPFYM